MILTIDAEGRITLPQGVLDDLKVAPGDSVQFELIGDTVKLLRGEAEPSQPEESRD